MNRIDTEAIILRTRDHGESDRLITFFTRERGKITGIAKGARRSRKRFMHAFEPFSLVELTFRERRSMPWVEACKLLEPHRELRRDLQRWALAGLAVEVTLGFLPENEPHEELFELEKSLLERLRSADDPLNGVLLFLFRFMHAGGYLEELRGCAVCGKALTEATRWVWKPGEGELVCAAHGAHLPGGVDVDLGTLRLILQIRRVPAEHLWRLRFGEASKRPLLAAFVRWARQQTGWRLKSVRLLEQSGAI